MGSFMGRELFEACAIKVEYVQPHEMATAFGVRELGTALVIISNSTNFRDRRPEWASVPIIATISKRTTKAVPNSRTPKAPPFQVIDLIRFYTDADGSSHKQNAQKSVNRGFAIWPDRLARTWMGVDGKHEAQSLRETAHEGLLFNLVAPGLCARSNRYSAHIISRGRSRRYMDRWKTTRDPRHDCQLPGVINRNREPAFLQHLCHPWLSREWANSNIAYNL